MSEFNYQCYLFIKGEMNFGGFLLGYISISYFGCSSENNHSQKIFDQQQHCVMTPTLSLSTSQWSCIQFCIVGEHFLPYSSKLSSRSLIFSTQWSWIQVSGIFQARAAILIFDAHYYLNIWRSLPNMSSFVLTTGALESTTLWVEI